MLAHWRFSPVREFLSAFFGRRLEPQPAAVKGAYANPIESEDRLSFFVLTRLHGATLRLRPKQRA
jgi:hypothetical protein